MRSILEAKYEKDDLKKSHDRKMSTLKPQRMINNSESKKKNTCSVEF